MHRNLSQEGEEAVDAGDGSLTSVHVALKPPDPLDLSAVMNETRIVSLLDTISSVSFVRPAPHSSIGAADGSFHTRTTATGQPRSLQRKKERKEERKRTPERRSLSQ